MADRASTSGESQVSESETKAKLDDLASLLDEMLAETGGPLTAEERSFADRALSR